MRKALLHGIADTRTCAADERAKAVIETESLVCVANEVEDGQASLALFVAQAATKLLEEDRGALGRTKEQDGVDGRQVHALVEEVAREQHVDLADPQLLESLGPFVVGCIGGHCERWNAFPRKELRHELGVLDRNTKAQRAYLFGIAN